MATHFSILAREISWTEEPGGLWSTGSQRVENDCETEHTYFFHVHCYVMFKYVTTP